jgi:hypothetical protein
MVEARRRRHEQLPRDHLVAVAVVGECPDHRGRPALRCLRHAHIVLGSASSEQGDTPRGYDGEGQGRDRIHAGGCGKALLEFRHPTIAMMKSRSLAPSGLGMTSVLPFFYFFYLKWRSGVVIPSERALARERGTCFWEGCRCAKAGEHHAPRPRSNLARAVMIMMSVTSRKTAVLVVGIEPTRAFAQ